MSEGGHVYSYQSSGSSYKDGGILCVDTRGAVFPMFGAYIPSISAICFAHDTCYIGGGDTTEMTSPVVMKFDKTINTVPTDNAGTTNTPEAVWTSKVYGHGENVRKECQRIEITYYNDSDYESGSDSGFKVQYRCDDEVDENNIPQYHDLPLGGDNDYLELSATWGERNKWVTVIKEFTLDKSANLWQFRVITTNFFKVLEFIPYLKGHADEVF